MAMKAKAAKIVLIGSPPVRPQVSCAPDPVKGRGRYSLDCAGVNTPAESVDKFEIKKQLPQSSGLLQENEVGVLGLAVQAESGPDPLGPQKRSNLYKVPSSIEGQMEENMRRDSRSVVIIGGLVTAIVLTPAQAQKVDGNTPLSPGDLVQFPENEYPPNAIYKIVACQPVGTPYRSCEMIRQSPDPENRTRSFNVENFRNNDVKLIGRADAAAPGAGSTGRAPSTGDAPSERQAIPAPTAAAGGTCPRTPYGGPVPGSRTATPALFRQKIADSYTMRSTATFHIGVTFEKVSVGSPIRNTVSNQPGIGAVRVNNGAPVGAMMYPVQSRHVVCEQGGTNVERRRVEGDYYCFVTRDQEWTCDGGGSARPPRITPL